MTKKSFKINNNGFIQINKNIFANDIEDITKRVENAFNYTENGSNQSVITKDKITQKLLPFYNDMVKSAVSRMWGNNDLKKDLPHNPQKVISNFNKSTDINHFYAIRIHSLLSYLIPRYWDYMQKTIGIAPGRLAYDLYQIPLNSSSTLNYFIFRGAPSKSYYLPNQFLFGGDVHDSNFYAVKHFLIWANNYLLNHSAKEVQSKKINLKLS